MISIKSLVFFLLVTVSAFVCQAQDLTLKINMRGSYESKITLLPLIGPEALKPVVERTEIRSGETVILSISKNRLPGEFVLRFDYKDKETSTPYPSEKRIFLSSQNLELWVNPPFCNNSDSTWFQKDERENTLFNQFSKENGKQKAQLGLLQNFLMSYDDNNSGFYKEGVKEYEKRRKIYNQWIASQALTHQTLFVSHTFQFQYLPEISFQGSETEKMQSYLAHYFDGVNFMDTLLIKTANLKEWMDGYVNIYGAMSKTETLRDSLFTLAGKNAIEKVKTGHSKVYGWMVDYFYEGYESFGIKKGMAMLQPYLNDPKCLTSRKQQILKRLDSMTRLVDGTPAPDFTLNNRDGSIFHFYVYQESVKFKLLLFWSADCGHCQQLVSGLKGWYEETGNKEEIDIIAVSLDETDTEVQKWEKAVKDLSGWKHLRAKGGVNSVVANDYAILSTPVMFLVDGKTNLIKAIPDSLEKLIAALEKYMQLQN